MQFPNTWEEFKQWYGFEDVKMEKRDFADMVIYFCQKVSEMNISRKCKMELLGMITAIEMKHDELMPKWIPVTEALPKEGESVIVCSQYGAICIVELVKGISEETRKKMKNGEIDDPCEKLWCLSDGYTMSKRSDLYKEGDEFGNNQKDYAWRYGPYHYSGQKFIAWMPLPEPYKEGE